MRPPAAAQVKNNPKIPGGAQGRGARCHLCLSYGTGFTARTQFDQQGPDGLCLPRSSELLTGDWAAIITPKKLE